MKLNIYDENNTTGRYEVIFEQAISFDTPVEEIAHIIEYYSNHNMEIAELNVPRYSVTDPGLDKFVNVAKNLGFSILGDWTDWVEYDVITVNDGLGIIGTVEELRGRIKKEMELIKELYNNCDYIG